MPSLDVLALRIYVAALRLCPQPFRDRFGGDMRATFAALSRDAAARGSIPLIALVLRECGDVVRAGVRARRRRPAPTERPNLERRTPVRTLLQDLRYAWRMLRRQPGFAVVAVATLALGIGATTAVFTVANGVLLRPLPYGHPDRLVSLSWGRAGKPTPWFSPLNFQDFTTQTHVFSGAAAFTPTVSNLTGLGDPERLEGAAVSWNFFDVLETGMQVGRPFVSSDGSRSNGRALVLSDRLWRRLFGGRTDAVGATVRLDGKPYTIVGVAPSDLALPRTAQFWTPLIFSPADVAPRARGAQWVMAVARLAPGTTIAQANTVLSTLAARLAAAYPNTNANHTAGAMELRQQLVRNVQPMLVVLFGAVLLVLLIACVNVANLLLARAQTRSREVAVRAALGAGRGRLLRQFLSESLLLGGLGAATGLAFAYVCLRALVALAPSSIPRLADVSVDQRVLAFTIATAVLTSVLFGLAPALASSSNRVARLIGTAGRGAVGGTGRLRTVLVVSEMALAVVLLVGAGLLIRSYQQLQQVDPGFSPDHVLTASISLPSAKYPTAASIGQFTSTLVERLRATPGVEGAAAAFGLPFSVGFSASTSFTRRGEPDSADTPSAGMRVVTPGYFHTLQIPLRAGRLFDAHDDSTSPEVVLVNQEAARRFWPGTNPIGQQIHIGVRLADEARSGQKTIVGIVGDVKYGGLDAQAQPEVYLPYAQQRVDSYTVALRAGGDPLALAPVLHRDIAALDRDLPVADVEPMTTLIGASTAQRRFTMLLLAAFAGVAVLLAAIGIYGVLGYLVSQRVQEIGVRLALGASPRDVFRLFLKEGAVLASMGMACGLAGAFAAARTLTSLLFGVTPADPVTFVIVVAALGGVALTASYVPARRAARVDPMTALRTE